jgi:hypothetical protein
LLLGTSKIFYRKSNEPKEWVICMQGLLCKCGLEYLRNMTSLRNCDCISDIISKNLAKKKFVFVCYREIYILILLSFWSWFQICNHNFTSTSNFWDTLTSTLYNKFYLYITFFCRLCWFSIDKFRCPWKPFFHICALWRKSVLAQKDSFL